MSRKLAIAILLIGAAIGPAAPALANGAETGA